MLAFKKLLDLVLPTFPAWRVWEEAFTAFDKLSSTGARNKAAAMLKPRI